MTRCEFCPELAQWRLRYITRFPLTKQERAKKLVPRGPDIENGPPVCSKHRNELAQRPSEREFAFSFLGAMPFGAHHS